MELYSVTGEVLYSGPRRTVKDTLVAAAQEGADLSGVQLRRARLRHACLDGLKAPGACLWGADLTGCDLAGADLRGADLRMTTLADCCLAEADCTGARFDGAFFRATLMTGADLTGCRFSCPSILVQSLSACRSVKGAAYWHRGETAMPLDAGIVRLEMGGHTIVSIGDELMIDNRLYEEWA